MGLSSRQARAAASRALGLAVVTMAVVATCAEAATVRSGPVRYVTTSGFAAADDEWRVEATCPDGSALAAGGGSVGGRTAAAYFSIFSPHFVLGGTSEFHVGGFNDAATGQPAKSVAICLARGGSHVVAQGETGTSPLDSFNGSTPCPPASRAIGGGVEFSGDPRDNAVTWHSPDLHPQGFAFASIQEGDHDPISRSAICLSNDDPRRLRYPDNEKCNVPLDKLVRIKAKCPKRSWVVGGGLGAFGGERTALKFSRPADGPDRDRKRDDAWRGALVPSDSRVVSIVAVCLKRPR